MANQGPKLSEIPACKVCYNHFDNDAHTPLLLPCGHTFCKICCEKLVSLFGAYFGENINFQMIKCPIDKQIYEKKELPKNF